MHIRGHGHHPRFSIFGLPKRELPASHIYVRPFQLEQCCAPQTSLENRRDTVDRYRAALEGPRIAEALVNKYDVATHLTIDATWEMLEAMEKETYTSQDLVAIKDRLDEFTKVVGEIVSLARRLSGLLVF